MTNVVHLGRRLRRRLGERIQTYARDLRTFPADAALAWGQGGFGGLWEQFAERTVHRVFRCNRYVVIAQSLDDIKAVPPPPGVIIEAFACSDDWTALSGIATQRERASFRRMAERGRVCLVAWRGDRAIGYTWHSDHTDPEIESLPIALPPGAAYLSTLFVDPSERNSGVGSALVSARLRFARDRGFREGWRMIAPGNRASFRTVDKTGGRQTRIVGEVLSVKIFRRVYARFRPRHTPGG